MYQFLKISLLTLIIFTVGILVGSYYHLWVDALMKKIRETLNTNAEQIVHFCPPPKIVKKHQYNPEVFEVEKLNWQMDYQGWEASKSIGFMQALINKDNMLVCYYQWPNPKDRGTNLWMTIHLLPPVNQIAKPYGAYWSITDEEKQALCRSGINACGFVLTESSKRIIPQQ